MRQGRLGFSLIELLVVLSIMVLLAGMLMPILGIARRTAKRQAAVVQMNAIGVALDAFKRDAGTYPWQVHPADEAGPWGNALAYRLMHRLDDANEHPKLRQDLSYVRTAYRPGGDCWIAGTSIDQPRKALSMTSTYSTKDKTRLATLLNRLASERACVAVLGGNTGILRTVPDGGGPWKDGSAVLDNPKSRGWCDDYLGGQLRRAEYTLDKAGVPDAIVDPYGGALVYVHAVRNGVVGTLHQDVEGPLMADWFALQAGTRSLTTSRASDIRPHAARQHLAGYELWSAGEDRRFHALRDDAANRDNLAAVDWQRGLQ